MGRLFAIGDIHGCLFQLEKLFRRLDISAAKDTVVFIGDYIDRGPDSKGVVDYILKLKKKMKHIICLRGNHEQMFMDYLTGGKFGDLFIYNGGAITLRSYGIPRGTPPADIKLPESHLEFFRSLLPYYETDDYIFVHAGLRPGITLSEQDPEDLVWIRYEFIGSQYDFGKTVVFGHTPLHRIYQDDFKIGIDTGSVYGRTLTCVELPSMIIHEVS